MFNCSTTSERIQQPTTTKQNAISIRSQDFSLGKSVPSVSDKNVVNCVGVYICFQYMYVHCSVRCNWCACSMHVPHFPSNRGGDHCKPHRTALEPQKFQHPLTFAHSVSRFNGHFNCPKCKYTDTHIHFNATATALTVDVAIGDASLLAGRFPISISLLPSYPHHPARVH